MKRCRRGHDMTAANSKPYNHPRTGRQGMACRACVNLVARLKYRNNDAFRERDKARTRTNYRKKKQAKGEPMLRARVIHGETELCNEGSE